MENDTTIAQDPILIAEELAVEDIISTEPEFVSELKSTGERILRFFIDIGTSGKYWEEKALCTSDYLIRYALINFFTIFGAMLLLGFLIANIKMELYTEATICFLMFLVAVTGFLLARTNIRQLVPAVIVSFFYGVFCVSLIYNGEINGANSLSIFVYPLVTIVLMGMFYGVIFSAVLLLFVSVEMFVPGCSHFEYNFDVASRTVISYILVSLTMVVIEFTRRTKDSLIRIQNIKLNELNEQLSRRISDFKPINEQKNAESSNSGLHIKTKGVVQFAPFCEISHIEVIDHVVYIKMRNKSLIKINTTFSKIEEQLSCDSRFVKCHRSYIINLNEVAMLSKRVATMNNGTKVAISRNFSYVKDSIERKRKLHFTA